MIGLVRRAALLLILLSLSTLAAAEDGNERSKPDPSPRRDAAALDQPDLEDDQREAGTHLRWHWLEETLDPWDQFKQGLKDDWGLDFLVSYDVQVQVGSHQHDRSFVGDRWELLGEWLVIGAEEEGDDAGLFGLGLLQFWFHRTQTLGEVRGAEYQAGLGSAWELNDLDTGGGDARNEIGWLSWEQYLLSDRVYLAVGKLDPSILLNDNRFIFDDRTLFNLGTLAKDPVVSMNESVGLGVFARLRLGPAYLSGIWVDADAKTRSIDFGSLDNGRYSFGAEVGIEAQIPGLGEGNYRASWFRTDSTGRGSDKKSAIGGAISIDQDLGERMATFFYWSRRSGQRAPLRQNLSAGVLFLQPFGLRHDLIGLAFSWGEPDGGQNKDDQFGLEAFWRLRIIDRVELSPILQYVIKPANSGTDTRLGGGLRLRIVL